jgi:hypothetical protein
VIGKGKKDVPIRFPFLHVGALNRLERAYVITRVLDYVQKHNLESHPPLLKNELAPEIRAIKERISRLILDRLQQFYIDRIPFNKRKYKASSLLKLPNSSLSSQSYFVRGGVSCCHPFSID